MVEFEYEVYVKGKKVSEGDLDANNEEDAKHAILESLQILEIEVGEKDEFEIRFI